VREAQIQTMARGVRLLGEILRMGQQRGEIRHDLSVEDMARTLQQALLGTVVLWSVGPASNLQKRLDTAFEVYWSGISLQRAGQRE
jgi:hypothetical protein